MKSFAHLSRSAVSVSNKSLSNKLSVLAVLGCAAFTLLPYDATSDLGGTVPMAQDPREPAFQLVARRSRIKRQLPSEPERSSPRTAESHKISSIRGPEPGTLQIPPAAEVKPGDPTPPNVWSDTQVIAALRECIRLLAPIAAEVELSEPLKQDQCGAPAPVLVRRIGSGATQRSGSAAGAEAPEDARRLPAQPDKRADAPEFQTPRRQSHLRLSSKPRSQRRLDRRGRGQDQGSLRTARRHARNGGAAVPDFLGRQ